MKKLRLSVLGATAACGCAIIPAPDTASADATGVCPDHYAPTFVIVLPGSEDVDRNGNLIVCAKEPPSSNEHVNAKDDKLPAYVDDIV